MFLLILEQPTFDISLEFSKRVRFHKEIVACKFVAAKATFILIIYKQYCEKLLKNFAFVL